MGRCSLCVISSMEIAHLARLPLDLTPFGSEGIACDVKWASSQVLDLFPPPLDLESLSATQANDLRSWLVAHVDIQPTPRRRTQPKSDPSDLDQPDHDQLRFMFT